jgi:XTP/dITP diphosphohydrolase
VNLLIATTNAGKLTEIRAALAHLPFTIKAVSEFAAAPEVVEDGKTFEENALKKARVLADFSGHLTLADDSGLEVDALGGAPGVYSARYAGDSADDRRNNEKLLRELTGLPAEHRGARFVCVLALHEPTAAGGRWWTFRGECEGRIAFETRGNQGFGYDPLFFCLALELTFGEVDAATKAKFSHRGKALRKLAADVVSLFSLPASSP